MLIQLNYKSGKATYLQIVDQVKYAAAAGAMRPGDPLPGIRPMAEELRINRNTVAKAYQELEHQGVVETFHGKGCFVSNTNSPLKKAVRQQILIQAVDAAIVQAHHFQIPSSELLALVRERLNCFEQKTKKVTPQKR